ncbi:MAG: asparagine synthase (glutamine-hydrolyzing), partial [Alphaproteobacteria bacterium]|nr:asparagine synthase (glutamine-hydrolyzing) [Alphaproteobacteria bacterium]
MCGIAGFVDGRHGGAASGLEERARAMNQALRHRGPDDGGVWTDTETGVALANRRLAVRDLSQAGHQPMVSDDGRLVLTYNGEIYDTGELRTALEAAGRRFRGGSDTEVLLHACAEWGVAETVSRCNGMFAFALWDRFEHRLTLARDRIGIKPLYWVRADGLFLFASELKALVGDPGWTPEIDRDALAAFARLSYVPSPLCIWKGARKLEPGTMLTLETGKEPAITRYWDMADMAGQKRDITDMNEAVEGLDSLLARAVGRRLVADVPVGLFLSGGMDSALVAALMRAQGAAPVKTFTVGFAETDFDESADAAHVAEYLGTEHHAIRLSPAETLDHVAEAALCYDEPFADSSQIPTLLVSRLARQSVTVALSGDGGDEVFGGYNRYAWAEHHWPRLSRIPLAIRRAVAGATTAVPPALWDRLSAVLGVRQAGEKAHKAAALLALDDEAQAYRQLTGPGIDTRGLVLGGREPPAPAPPGLDDAVERMQMLDTVGYLPDDILT